MTLAAEDRVALSTLVHRYAADVDARAFDDVVALFTPDAVLVVPEPPETLEPAVERHGHAGVREALETLAGMVRTVHEITGEIYDAGPHVYVAHGRVSGVAHHLVERDRELVDVVWRLRYADDYRRTTEDWRIARRELTVDVVEVRPVRQVRR